MTTNSKILTLTVKNHHSARLRAGHLWIFDDDLTEPLPPEAEAGSLAEVKSAGGHSYGSAILNPKSRIVARLLASNTRSLDAAFFRERILRALSLRERLLPGENSYRLLFGESDFVPGLVVDKYADVRSGDDFFAIQTLSVAMDNAKEAICAALCDVFPRARGIVEKNSSSLRTREGLPPVESELFGETPEEITIAENGIISLISLKSGQKTGYFLDQKRNRCEIKRLSAGLRVLDCFCNQGGFALHAVAGGAASALGIDSSASAVERARLNAEANGIAGKAEFAREEALDFLHAAAENARETKPWDMIILDPPAFAKSRAQVPQAKRGYAKINRMALRLLPPGGFLATGSCSHHVAESALLSIIQEEAERERRRLRLIFRGGQSPCHPILGGMPETEYLKFFIFEAW
jgi:23S rRNA (cytosine1962-C5)-methyltransferase